MNYDNYWNEQNLAYQKDRDKISDEQWQAEFDEAKRQFDEQMDLKTKSSSSSSSSSSKSSSSSSKSSSSSYTKNPGYTKDQIISLQKAAGITADGVWGPQTAAAYDKGVRPKEKELSSYAQLTKDLDAIVAGQDSNGKKVEKGEVSSVIREAQKNGEITQNQAQQLLNKYTPKGYTY